MFRLLRLGAFGFVLLGVACDSTPQVRLTEGRRSADASYGRFDAKASLSADAASAATRILEQPRQADDEAARGRAELALGRPVAAAATLGLAASGKADASIANDLAVALLAVPVSERSLKTTVRALDAAARALRLAPSDPRAALFNMGIAAERIGLHTAAIAAWDQVRGVESEGGWLFEITTRRDDAAEGLDADQKKSGADLQIQRERFFATALPDFGRTSSNPAQLAVTAEALKGSNDDRFAYDCVAALSRPAIARPADRERIGQGLVMQGAGLVHYAAAEYERADAAFAAAVVELREAEPCALMSLVNLGMTRRQARDYATATRIAERVLDVAKRGRYASLEARALWLRGLVRQDQSDVEPAIVDYARAIELYEAGQEADNAASVTRVSSDAFRNLGDLEGGWRLLEPRLKHVYSLATPLRRHLFLLNAALYAAEDGLPDAAIVFQTAALEEAKTRAVAGSLVGAYLRRASFYQKVGDRARAVADLDVAERWMPKAAKDSESSAAVYRARLRVVRAGLLDESPALARHLLSDDLIGFFLRSTPEEAPRIFLQRGMLARVQGREAIAARDFQDGLAEFGRQWGKLNDRDRRGTFMNVSWELFDQSIAASLKIDPTGAAAFTLADSSRARGTSGTMLRGATLRAVQRLLPPDAVLLYFASLSQELLCWRITPDGVELQRKPVSRAALAEAIDRYSARIQSARDTGDIEPEARRLFALIVDGDPGNTLPPNARVLVSPDGPLHRLAFASLVNPRNGRFLVEEHTVELIGRADDMLDARPRILDPRSERALVVGHMSGAATGTEIQAVANGYGVRSPLTGAAATPTAFLDAFGRASIIHVASHAEANEAFPWASHLRLAPDASHPRGWLTAAEIADRPSPRLKLVVLAACETAAGRAMQGEGLIGIVRAFLRPGVSVVGSLWKVDDATTAKFMLAFHAAYIDKGSAAIALRAAQLALFKSTDPTDRLPQNWAAFEVFGARAGSRR